MFLTCLAARSGSSGARAGGLRGLARLDGQDGRGRAADDALGDAAYYETVESGAAVGADHDEVGVLLAGGVGDLYRRRPGPENAPRGQAVGGGGGHALAESLLAPLALLLPDPLEGGAGELGVGVQGHLAEDVDERQLAPVDARELAGDLPGGLRGVGEVGRAQDSLEHVGVPPRTVIAWAVPASRSELQPRAPPAPPQPWADLPKVLDLAKRRNAALRPNRSLSASERAMP